MAWTYSGDPTTSEKDAVRFHIGDTETADQLVQDEEINYALARKGGVYPAAVVICKALAARFVRKAISRTIGKLSISMSDRAKSFLDLAYSLELEACKSVIPYSGGLSVSEKETAALDSSSVQPTFFRGMMENDGSGTFGAFDPDD